jgi:hypothetical protein
MLQKHRTQSQPGRIVIKFQKPFTLVDQGIFVKLLTFYVDQFRESHFEFDVFFREFDLPPIPFARFSNWLKFREVIPR